MVDIIPNRKGPSFGQKFSNAIGAGLQGVSQMYQQHQANEMQGQRNQQLNQLSGMDISALPENMQQEILKAKFAKELQSDKYGFENQKKADELRGKQEENIKPLEGALDTVAQMRKLRKKGNLGIGTNYSPFAETRKQAGEYEQLGKSLIQYASNIPIRNKLEFETLAEELYDPSITDARAEGVLNAMERIIRNSIEAAGGSQESPQQQKRPPLSAFQR